MTKTTLEKYQVLLYLCAIVAGLSFGFSFPGMSGGFQALLWPILGLLLFTTFTQISISGLRYAFTDTRFIGAALVGNFLVIPLLIWGIVTLLPDYPSVRLGVAMVLLVPCTDWFITFSQLGRGDTERAIAFSPVSLLLQILLLPGYLFLFFGRDLTISLATNQMLLAFGGIILLPLFAAFLTQKWTGNHLKRQQLLSGLGWMPVPLLELVIFLISASQFQILTDATSMLIYPAAVFAGFLLFSTGLAKLFSYIARLPAVQGRVLAFSFGSRNSFVVLPLALALPAPFELTALVIVLQSLIELFGMALFVWLIPNVLFK